MVAYSAKNIGPDQSLIRIHNIYFYDKAFECKEICWTKPYWMMGVCFTLDRLNVNPIDERRSKIVTNKVFDCHLSPDKR